MSENLKELVLKNGKIVVEDKAKDLRIRKNNSLPERIRPKAPLGNIIGRSWQCVNQETGHTRHGKS